MQVKTLGFVWLLGTGSLGACFFTACNGDDDLIPPAAPNAAGGGGESHGAGSAECEAIGRLCHDADTGSGTASECHSTGHEGDAHACSAIFSSCIDTCVPAEGGEAGGSGEDAAPHCRAMGSLCHDADTGPGRGRDCHNIGHAGDEEACIDEFDDCVTFCLAAAEHGGEGGSGGGHAHAGGEGGGGHAHPAGGHGGAHEHGAAGHGGAHEHGASGHGGAHEHAASGAAGEHEQAAGHGGG